MMTIVVLLKKERLTSEDEFRLDLSFFIDSQKRAGGRNVIHNIFLILVNDQKLTSVGSRFALKLQSHRDESIHRQTFTEGMGEHKEAIRLVLVEFSLFTEKCALT